jgi:hypothetical protein
MQTVNTQLLMQLTILVICVATYSHGKHYHGLPTPLVLLEEACLLYA